MVEKLKTYRAELEAVKEEVLTKDDTVEIEQLVAEYKTNLEAEFAEKREETVSKIDSDIQCLTRYIERLEAEIAIETAEVSVDFSTLSNNTISI